MANDRPWTAFYGPSVPNSIDDMPYRSLGDFITSTAAVYGDLPAFTTVLANGMNGTLTFRRADEMSDALAVYLRDIAGLQAGDRVAVQVPNCLSYPVAAMAVFKAGCVLVNVNPLYTADEMAEQSHRCRTCRLSSWWICFADKLAEAMKTYPVRRVIVTRVAEYLPRLPKMIVGLVQKHWDKSVLPITIPRIRLPRCRCGGTCQA
ncbi:MAG: AMP-binding protein [Rhodobacterales bacterium]